MGRLKTRTQIKADVLYLKRLKKKGRKIGKRFYGRKLNQREIVLAHNMVQTMIDGPKLIAAMKAYE
jgi:hypothetical protein